MNYVVAIPSYKRSETICNKTIKILQHYDIDPDKIYVFCVEDEYQQYKDVLPDGIHLIIGVLGLVKQREFIHSFFPEDTNIVFADDNITGFINLDRKPYPCLDTFIKSAFQSARSHGGRLWGLYPVANPFFMDGSVTTGLKFILGTFYGVVNTPSRPVIPLDHKEDIYRTCAYYKADKIVLRFNYIAVKTTYAKGKGGMNEDRTLEKEMDGALQVRKDFPEYAKIYYKSNNQRIEVRLKHRP